jgi:predicted protein tyrosine phosphatase
MKIKVTNFEDSIKEQNSVDFVLGFLDAKWKKRFLRSLDFSNRAVWWFDDVWEECFLDSPRKEHIKDIIQTVKEKELLNKNIIVHCVAGVSRSTAIAISLLVMSGMNIDDAIKEIEIQRPFMWPNELIIRFFDEELGLNGELIRKVQQWKILTKENLKKENKMWIWQLDGSWVKEDI